MKMRIEWSAIIEVPESEFASYEARTAEEVVANQREWYADGSGDVVADLGSASDSEIRVELVEE